MSTLLSRSRCLALAIAGALVPLAAAALEEVKVGGTGNALGTMRLLGAAFTKGNPDIRVIVLPSMGSGGAIKAVAAYALDIGLSARALTPEERKLGATDVEYARSLLVFAVAQKSSMTAVTLDQLADIYSGRTASAPDGSPIRPVLRQVGDDNTDQIKRMSPALDKAMDVAQQRQGMAFATSDQEAADKTEAIPGAMGNMALSLILSENRALRPLAVNGVEATVANAASGAYPHAKRFFFIVPPQQGPAARRFIAFTQSPAGRDILARAGNWVP